MDVMISVTSLNSHDSFRMDDQLSRMGAPLSEPEKMKAFLSQMSEKEKKKLMKWVHFEGSGLHLRKS